jgi:hypothetical protein
MVAVAGLVVFDTERSGSSTERHGHHERAIEGAGAPPAGELGTSPAQNTGDLIDLELSHGDICIYIYMYIYIDNIYI